MAGEAKDNKRRSIIIKRYKRGAAAHHGGAWKVAYADFVTAMMAFFLVMWLVTAVSKEQRAAIFDYFKNPSMEPGKSVKPAPGMMGPGGASTSPIDLGGGLDAPRTVQSIKPGIGSPVTPPSPKDSLGGTQSADDRGSIERQGQGHRGGERAQAARVADGRPEEGHRQEPGARALQGSAAARHHAGRAAYPDRRRSRTGRCSTSAART